MHVFFDERIFLTQQVGGISRYVCMLAEQLSRGPRTSATVFGGASRNLFLRQLVRRDNLRKVFLLRRDRFRINTHVERLSRIWRRFVFLSVRRRHASVVYHPTYYEVDPFIARRADAAVVTFYDMIPEWLHAQAPDRRSIRFLKQRSEGLSQADAVLAISESTRRDLERCHPSCAEKIIVTPLAACLANTPPAPLPPGLPNRYFLFVGNREGYKNGVSTLQAMAQLRPLFSEVGAVFLGGGPFSAEESALLGQHGLAGQVHQLDGDDALVVACYRQAVALVFPSLYEGFGLPVLEAMQLGCPVITSNTSSLPEVGGDAAVYVDPQDVAGLAKAMMRVLLEPDWRATLVEKGFARSAQFSWSKTADRTLKGYHEAVARRNMVTSIGVQTRPPKLEWELPLTGGSPRPN
jgi:glycosyltransferase involved in cell wall biosynthesis